MRHWLFQLTTVLAGLDLSLGNGLVCTERVEEGHSAQFSRELSPYEMVFPLSWRVRTNTTWEYAGVCQSTPQLCVMQRSLYEASVKPIPGSDWFNRTFTLKSVAVNTTAIQVIDGLKNSDSCEIQVYVRPSTPVCVPPVVSSQNISLHCIISNSYPGSVCSIRYKGNKYDENLFCQVTSNFVTAERITHCTFVCAPKTTDYEASRASFLYQFKVSAYPNISEGQLHTVNNAWSRPPVTAYFRIFTANSEGGTIHINDGDRVSFMCFTNQREDLSRLEIRKGTYRYMVASTSIGFKLTYTERSFKCSEDKQVEYNCMARGDFYTLPIGTIQVKCSAAKSSSSSGFPVAYIIIIIVVISVGFGVFSGFCLLSKRKRLSQSRGTSQRTPGHHFAVSFPDRRATSNLANDTTSSEEVDAAGSNSTENQNVSYTISHFPESHSEQPPSYESVIFTRDRVDLGGHVESPGHHWDNMPDPPSYESVTKIVEGPSATPSPPPSAPPWESPSAPPSASPSAPTSAPPAAPPYPRDESDL